jgi:hypothetical protein
MRRGASVLAASGIVKTSGPAGASRWRRSHRHRFSDHFSALAATAFVGGGEHVDPLAQHLDYPRPAQ